jgi:hypothetical protein
MPPDTLLLHVIGRAASVRADSIDVVARTVEIVWTTGATVQRRRWEGWDEIREYDEELIVTPTAVRLERMNGGAPFLDSHDGWSLRSVLGAIEPGSVRIEGGQGVATIRLTSAPDAADTVHRILEKTSGTSRSATGCTATRSPNARASANSGAPSTGSRWRFPPSRCPPIPGRISAPPV